MYIYIYIYLCSCIRILTHTYTHAGNSLSRLLWFLDYLIYPFVQAVSFFSSLELNFDTIGITCDGASAPLKLLTNCIILGITVIVITSDYRVYENVFTTLNQNFVTAVLHFNLGILIHFSYMHTYTYTCSYEHLNIL